MEIIAIIGTVVIRDEVAQDLLTGRCMIAMNLVQDHLNNKQKKRHKDENKPRDC